jgi:4-hydroxy-2-oxoheptanedioate aldolase
MVASALHDRWRDGGTALGAWISLRDPLLAEVAATSGYDYVCIDMQHGMSDYTHVTTHLHAMARTPTVPIVRVPWNEQGIIGRVLDAGALGVIIPMVNSPEEARRAVDACRYAPHGTRSFGPLGASTRYGGGYAGTANDVVACIPMIETRQAVESVDEILAVPGIDAVYVGPADLSLTYGLRPAVDHDGDPFNGALATIVDACQRHGVVPGIHANAELAAKRHAAGFRMITVGLDASPATAALRADVTAARAAIDDGPASAHQRSDDLDPADGGGKVY